MKNILNIVLTYLFHVAAVALVGIAAKYGFHLSVPVFPTSLGTFAVVAFVKMLFKNFSHAIHSGKLQAEIEAQLLTAGRTVVQDIIDAVEGK